eukprot:c50295_g1_i1 orf=50-208(+)
MLGNCLLSNTFLPLSIYKCVWLCKWDVECLLTCGALVLLKRFICEIVTLTRE